MPALFDLFTYFWSRVAGLVSTVLILRLGKAASRNRAVVLTGLRL